MIPGEKFVLEIEIFVNNSINNLHSILFIYHISQFDLLEMNLYSPYNNDFTKACKDYCHKKYLKNLKISASTAVWLFCNKKSPL